MSVHVGSIHASVSISQETVLACVILLRLTCKIALSLWISMHALLEKDVALF